MHNTYRRRVPGPASNMEEMVRIFSLFSPFISWSISITITFGHPCYQKKKKKKYALILKVFKHIFWSLFLNLTSLRFCTSLQLTSKENVIAHLWYDNCANSVSEFPFVRLFVLFLFSNTICLICCFIFVLCLWGVCITMSLRTCPPLGFGQIDSNRTNRVSFI